MTDSHCHLNMGDLKENLQDELEEFVKRGGEHILNPGSSIREFPEVIATALKYKSIYPNLIKTALGLHPESLYQNQITEKDSLDVEKITRQIAEFEKAVDNNQDLLSAIGETGLDYHQIIYDYDKNSQEDLHPEIVNTEEVIEIQKLSFRRHLHKALELDLPLTIHSRENSGRTECIEDTLKIIVEVGKGKIKGCMHSYTGSIDFLRDIIDLGLFVGYNAIITYKSGENVRELVQQTPIKQILLETDAPFLPMRHKGAKSYGNPTDIDKIAQAIGEIKGLTKESVIRATSENFKALFG